MTNDLEAIRVLVVDDEQDIRVGSERILGRLGFIVLQAGSGEEALKILQKDRVSIVLLDLKMPGMDGLEVLSRIRESYNAILVIVITGYATVEIATEAMKQGAYDFISKPFEPDQLRIIVNRASEKIRLTRETKKLEEDRKRTLSDLDTEKSRIHTIVESLPDGVLVTNAKGQVVLMNPAFKQLMGLDPDLNPGNPIGDYLPDKDLCKLVMETSQGKYVDYEDIPDYELALSAQKYLLARAKPVLGEKKECLGAVVNFVDITTMKVLDRLKSEFVAKVSHELRSPLSTIHEQLAVVLQELIGEGSAQEQRILSRAKEKTRGLISLIGDLLDLSRIEEGLICRAPEPVRFDEQLKNIVDFLKPQADGKGQSLNLEFPKGPLPLLTADPIALESIFGNLITNAINYTQEGGEIKIVVDLAGINLRVKVIDNGFGIADKHLEKIFERFYRVKDEKTRFITGTGLGLPIVKGLLDSMGGFISVESAPGKGSVFTVLLPGEIPAEGR
ncbi:MAG: hybrid sensor histidine kinase/response regulator [Deltaproteobacteria bacterium RBG_13_49_15]|nr:MAG: hybrid sensor histidine kinase/response regulator [Deltaproteobacteria bacterium RBG_13_49_15]